MRKYILKVIGLIIAVGILLTACGPSKNTVSNLDSSKITVYTSFYPMYDFVKKVGGDKVRVVNLVPAGTEPHDWEPTPTDIVNVQNANVFVYNGLGMEAWTDKVLRNNKNSKLITVETSKGLELLKNQDKVEEFGFDPHVWLNPLFAKKQLNAIKDALITVDAVNKDYYEKNYIDNSKKFDELDQKFKNTISRYSKKDIVVAHQAFGYLCNAYGLNQIAIEGFSADSEPSPAKMAEISKFAKNNNVKYIFFEELISPKIAETIAREVGAQTAVLNPLEGLTQEELNVGKDYFSVMRDNLDILTKGLQ